ncbi:MAG: ABC transporter permease subunit [Pseudomonadota bacterium]
MKKQHIVILAVIFGLFVAPLPALILYSISGGWSYPHLAPEKFSSHALEYVRLQQREILFSLGYSIYYSLLTAILAFVVCLFPAQALARRDFKFKSLLEGLLLAPALAPVMTFSMGIHYLFIKIGLADTTTGVVLVLTIVTYPYMLRTLISGLESFSPGYVACAKNLGAGPLARFFRVEWPLLAPAAVAGGSVVFLIAVSEYFLLFLIGGGSVPSYSGFIFPFLASSDRSLASLLTLIFLAAPIFLFAVIDLAISRLYGRMGLS